MSIDIATGAETLLGGDFDEFPGEVAFSRDGQWVVSAVDEGLPVLVGVFNLAERLPTT